MRNPQVHWYEGLFLRPHHFQASDRHWAEAVHTSHQWDTPYHYGLHAFDHSKEALGNSQFRVNLLQARMRDGTLIDIDFGEELDDVNLKQSIHGLSSAIAELEEAFQGNEKHRLYDE